MRKRILVADDDESVWGALLPETMKVVIQQRNRGPFLKGPDLWTSDRELALAFRQSLDALSFCQQVKIRSARLRYCFHDPKFDFTVGPFETGFTTGTTAEEPATLPGTIEPSSLGPSGIAAGT
jgi:hypothetical protein